MVRLVDALQFAEQYGEVCPAGCNKGEEGMKPTAEGVADYLKKHSDDLYHFKCLIETVSKIVDRVQGQGVQRIESGAYT